MAEDIISIGIAYETSQLTTGSRAVQSALQQLVQASRQMVTASEQLAGTSTKTAGAIGQEGKAASSTANSVAQLGQSASAASRQVTTLGGAMQSFGQQVGAFALAQAGVMGLQQALGTLQAAFVDLIRTGVEMAQLRGSFAAIAGGASAGTREFQFAVKTANQLGLEVQSVAEQYRSLSAATRGTNLEGAATRDLFTTLARAAQAYGLSTEQLGRASTAFQQIISKGKVSMEELRGQLGEAIPGAMQIAARAYGTSTAALEDMISKGVEAGEFVRKFTAQLNTEVPPAADRAGKGIKQFGNEIYLLKDRIAQSGLIAFLDSALGKVAELMRRTREAEEREAARVERRATREQGPGAPLDTLAVQQREALLAKTKELVAAEDDYKARQKAQTAETFLGIKTQTGVARERVEQLKQELEALRVRQRLETEETQAQQKRRGAYEQGYKEQQAGVDALDTANKNLKTTLDANKKAQDDHNKSAALTSELYGKANGTLQEQNRFLEARKKINEASLKDLTEAIIGRGPGTGAVPPELLARHAALRKEVEADTATIERNKDAISEAEKARTKAINDAAAARKAYSNELAQLDEQIKKAGGSELEAFEIEMRHRGFQGTQLDTLIAKHKELIAARKDVSYREELARLSEQLSKVTDDELAAFTAEMQRKGFEGQQLDTLIAKYKELTKAKEDARAVDDRLKERNKLLQDQATASAATLNDLQRLEKQLEPRRRDQSRAEQLAGVRKQIETLPGLDEQGRLEALARADAKIREALDTEAWQEWEDFATESLETVQDAITQFAFHGKMTFKEMTTAIAEDFFRMSLKMVMESAFSGAAGAGTGGSGGQGWLKVAFDAGLKLLGAGSTAGGGGVGLTGGDAPGMQHGGPVTAGSPYVVGEAGPELFVPRQAGTIVPNGQMPGGTTVINVNVHGVQDVQGFHASRGALQRGIAGAVSQAYRGL
jgi:tape measure domain-containing protein